MLLKKLFPIPDDIPPYLAQYSSYLFIYSFSVLVGVTLIYYTFFNLFVTGYYQLAMLEGAVIFGLLVIHRDLHIHQNVTRSSYLFIGLITLLLGSLNLFIEKEFFIIIWNIFLPIATFYLLGSKKGAIWVSLYLIALFSYIYSLPHAIFPHGTQDNFILAYVLLCLALYIYEHSRSQTYMRLETIVKSEQQHAMEMTRLSTIDKLTQTCNRLKLDEILDYNFKRAHRYKEKFSLIMIDLDHFKDVNDQYGHLVGDKILVDFSKLIKQSIRKNDIFGRWGGEEFMLILPHASLQQALKTASQLRKVIQEHDFSYKFSNTASFGVISFDKNQTLLELVNNADKALYLAKKSGRNCVKTLLEVADLQPRSFGLELDMPRLS